MWVTRRSRKRSFERGYRVPLARTSATAIPAGARAGRVFCDAAGFGGGVPEPSIGRGSGFVAVSVCVPVLSVFER
jgi:hypothetical protein